MQDTQSRPGGRVWTGVSYAGYPVVAGREGMRKEFMYRIPSLGRERGYEKGIHMQDTQSPLGGRVWTGISYAGYPVATGREGMGKEFMYKIPSRGWERGYEKGIHVQDTQSSPGERVWTGVSYAGYPVVAGRECMRKKIMYRIPSRRRERGYGQAFCMQDTQSSPGERV